MNAKLHPKKQRSNYDGKIAGLYDMEETIGRGHFAVVKLARHVFTGEKVAVKVIDKTKLDEVSRAHLFQEVRCMKLVQHPNVVRLYEVIDTQTKLYLILELGDGGDMYDYIMKHEKGLSEDLARRYFRQIVQAISYCHKLHVVHRDLKPENVVFFEKLGIVKLTDFGFSNKFQPGRKLETSCGSLAYSAPEILLGDSYDAPAVDVWSLGVILYMLVCGEPPFREANDSETLTMIMDCKYHLPPHIDSHCRELIGKMLTRDPAHRASLDQILGHLWLTQGDHPPIPITPLVSRESLTEDDHGLIVQKMVDGKIAPKEEVLQSLEKDAYNHITATYYLLAERRLRKKEEQASAHLMRSQDKPNLAPLALSPRVQSPEVSQADMFRRNNTVDSLVSPPGTHPAPSPPGHAGASPANQASADFMHRRCSLIREESMEEDEGEEVVEERDVHSSRSLEDHLSDDSDTRGGSGKDTPPPDNAAATAAGAQITHTRKTTHMRPLHSVRSSPQLLNQIYEEGESDDDIIIPHKISMPRQAYQQRNIASASPEILKRVERRKKRLTAGNRGTSCSSSDASDTDETDQHKRKEKLKHRFTRRDSSDHSSDTDGPGAPPGGSSGGSNRPFGGSSGRDENNRDDDNSQDKNNRDKSWRSNNGGSSSSGGSGRGGGRQQRGVALSKDLDSETRRKLSGLSVSSHLSNLSLSSLTSRSSKYLPDSNTTLDKAQSSSDLDVDALNEENKHRSHVIHVRSRDFSDLMDTFGKSKSGHKIEDAENMSVSSVSSGSNKESSTGSGGKNGKLRRRSKDKMKMDINRNGLKSDIMNMSNTAPDVQKQGEMQITPKTKCCRLI